MACERSTQRASGGLIKTDCVVLDFRHATLMHGSLERTSISTDTSITVKRPPGRARPEATVPLGCRECPLCGFVWEERDHRRKGDALADFVMTDDRPASAPTSAGATCSACDDALMATGFNAWGGVFFLNGRWHAVGGVRICSRACWPLAIAPSAWRRPMTG